MKKIFILASLLFSVSATAQSFIETVKEGRLRFDCGIVGGTYGYSKDMIQPVYGFEVTCAGIMFGVTEYPGNTIYDSKPVHVSSYTKKDGTHVSSYNRSLPGHKGSTHHEYIGAEMYVGFWIPCMISNNSNLYAAPVIGVTGKDFNNDIVYGAGIKYVINSVCPFGISVKVTNYSLCLGLSFAMPKNIY